LKEAENNIEELAKVGVRVEELLESLSKLLEEDKKREKELQELVGRLPTPPEREEFVKDFEQYLESHKKAMKTNTELIKIFEEHKHNLDLLTGPPEGLIAALPSLNIIDTPIDDGAVQRLRDLIYKVEQMKTQRKDFEAELRKGLEEDDITQLLVTRTDGNKAHFFEEQLKKHSPLCDLIQKNLDAQDKILRALTEANAKYAPTRQAVKETAQRRDEAVQTFILSHDTFFELKGKLSRGLRFYEGLEKTVLKLEENFKKFTEKRKKEMDKIEEREKAKIAKEKVKMPPARPGAGKPPHLVSPSPSGVPNLVSGPFAGAPRHPHPSMIPGAPSPSPPGIPLQPRIPGGVFPPGSPPGPVPPRPVDPRVLPPGSQGISPRPAVPQGDPRMRTPHPGLPPQGHPASRNQEMLPEQRVPQLPTSLGPGTSIHPSMPGQTRVPFSQVGPRGPAPAEHLIHSTPRMSYPVPEGPSLVRGLVPAGAPGGPHQAPQQPPPQLLPGQIPRPSSSQGLPSYDQAKFLPGPESVNAPLQPTVLHQVTRPRGQLPSPTQPGPGGPQLLANQLNRPPLFSPEQQLQGPRVSQPTSQTPLSHQGGAPQMYQQQFPPNQMSQPMLPTRSQHQPKNWQTQPFQFPKQAQQAMQPPQPRQQFPRQPQQQFHPPLPGQPPFRPQSVPPSQPQLPQPLSSQQLVRAQQQLPQLQQRQQLQRLPQPHFEQPINPFQQPPQVQPQFSQPQQQMPRPREPIQATQIQQTQQPKCQSQQLQQRFQTPIHPTSSYNPQQLQQPLQPLRPQHPPQFQQQQPRGMQPPSSGERFSLGRMAQQTANPGHLSSQDIPTPAIQQGSKASEMVPQISPKTSQTPSQQSWQQESSGAQQTPPIGYPPLQPHPSYNQGQQLPSTPLSYPLVPESKPSKTDPISSKPSQEGHLAQYPGFQRPVGAQSTSQPFHTPAGSSGSWHVSQPLPSSGNQQLLRQDLKEVKSAIPQAIPYKQSSVEQSWGSSGLQQLPQPRQEQREYPPPMAGQNSSDFDKQSQYQGLSRGPVGFYSSYSTSGSVQPSSSPGVTHPYSISSGSAPSAVPLVQGVRASPTSLPPSSAYATSYSVSVAQAQLSQQQQMQQLQTQMLLQQQQLFIQQQELLRNQQQQQHHESDQGQLTQLFQQVLQQRTKLEEMEQKLAEHERTEDKLKMGHEKKDHDESSSEEKNTEVAANVPRSLEKGHDDVEKDPQTDEKGPQPAPPVSSSSFSASWGLSFVDGKNGKFTMEQVFSDLAKKQISEISDVGKDGKSESHKEQISEEGMDIVPKKEGEQVLVKEKAGDAISAVTGLSSEDVNGDTAQVIDVVEVNVSVPAGETAGNNRESCSVEEGVDTGKSVFDLASKGKMEVGSSPTEETADEDKEKKMCLIEEQIQRIRELQKSTQPVTPPLPQKQRYLYEPGKMPEQPLKPPEKVPTEETEKPSLHRQCGHYYDTQLSRIGQDENNECLTEEEYIQRLNRTVETFDALVVSLGQKRENSPYNGFISEWKVLEKLQESDSSKLSTEIASVNPSKNRYRDILPWDHTRVKLMTKEGGDYINANLIKNVTPLSPDYILTQGPIAATLGDFWLMVWEQKAPVIVMLTKEVEGNRLKCHQYWPIDEGHTVVYGAIRVHMRRVNHCAAWIERNMHVQHAESDEILAVSHLQFVGWPDHGVPHSPSDLLTFLSEVHDHRQEKDLQAQRPLVVHCSAGVGRAGTFCVVYSAIRELHGTRSIVNIPKLVQVFRKHRKFVVQKKEQYEFCYRAILYYANQFVQLEKAALDLRKSKTESDDVSNASSETSLSNGQRKPNDVSFSPEISDEDSYDSLDELYEGDRILKHYTETQETQITSNSEATDHMTNLCETERGVEKKDLSAHDEILNNHPSDKGCAGDATESVKTATVSPEGGLEMKDSPAHVEEQDSHSDSKQLAKSPGTVETSDVKLEEGMVTKDLSAHVDELDDLFDTKCIVDSSESPEVVSRNSESAIPVTITNEEQEEDSKGSLPEDTAVKSVCSTENEASWRVDISSEIKEIEEKYEKEESEEYRETKDSSESAETKESLTVAGNEVISETPDEISGETVEKNDSAGKEDNCDDASKDCSKDDNSVKRCFVEEGLKKGEVSATESRGEESCLKVYNETEVEDDVSSKLQEQKTKEDHSTANESNVNQQNEEKEDGTSDIKQKNEQLKDIDTKVENVGNQDDRQKLSLQRSGSEKVAENIDNKEISE